ncbi:hypothetical protein [Draconibacterium sp.]|uniref:hypothetical protein n=1 Tax=Draconibacterium sp. TaxID=1965318 RepID=UPI0035617732
MKRLIIYVAVIILFSCNVSAQQSNRIILQVAANQIELGYQHKLFNQKMWGQTYVGLGNQDVNSSFNDLLAGIKIGFDAWSNSKNTIWVNSNIGIYIPNNDYYTAVTPVIGVGIGYSRYIGKSGKHALLLNAGYQYGERDYRQKFSSRMADIETVGNFSVAPLYFSLGYGFNF